MERAEEDHPDLPWSSYVFAVWNLIIRPPRQRYSQNDLVRTFPHGGFIMPQHHNTRVHRKDFTVTNSRGLKLACTIFEPMLDDEPHCRERACVVYCHGNSSSRMSGFELVPVLCPLNIAVMCFDFSGSGWSGGDYVSLGFHEREDLRAVIEHLRGHRGGSYTRIGVWGYSMGAVTALMFTASDMSIAGVLADSPFSDLTDLIKDLCRCQLHLPDLLINAILPVVRLAIQRKANFDIYDVSASKHVDKCFVPGLFLHGEEDVFIPPDHSSLLESRYAGESMRIVMPYLTHNCQRPRAFLDRAAVFFVRAMRWEPFLPKGVTEDQLSRRARRHLQPSTGPKRSIQNHNAELAQVRSKEALKLIVSSKFVERSCGFVKVACELCHAYQGAEMVPISGSSMGRCPVRFSCSITLPGDGAELALCWSQEQDADRSCVTSEISEHDHRAVYFAVISSSTASLTRVVLAPASSTDVGLGSSTSSLGGQRPAKSFAGFMCTSVEPLALAVMDLAVSSPHEVVLRILHGGIEFSVGGKSISCEQCGTRENLCIWCVQWKPTGMDERAFGRTPPLTLHLKTSPEKEDGKVEAILRRYREGSKQKKVSRRNGSAKHVDPMERRLADQLASLCSDRVNRDPVEEHCTWKDMEGCVVPTANKANLRTHMLLDEDVTHIGYE